MQLFFDSWQMFSIPSSDIASTYKHTLPQYPKSFTYPLEAPAVAGMFQHVYLPHHPHTGITVRDPTAVVFKRFLLSSIVASVKHQEP